MGNSKTLDGVRVPNLDYAHNTYYVKNGSVVKRNRRTGSKNVVMKFKPLNGQYMYFVNGDGSVGYRTFKRKSSSKSSRKSSRKHRR